MKAVSRRRRKRKGFDFHAKRRSEIVKHARHVGAVDTEDFDRWLIQWAVHNPGSKDEIWAVMNAARRMGGKITEAQAEAICDEAACSEVTTSEIVEVAFALRLYRGDLGKRSRDNFARSIRRAADRVCIRVRRSETGKGRPWLWRLRDPDV